MIQSVDRSSIVEALKKAFDRLGAMKPVFIQVNVGNEPQKSGVAISEVEALLDLCRSYEFDVCGVMGIPPNHHDPIPFFTLLKKLQDRFTLKEVSMGMSEDYEKALQCKSTLVRVGSILFNA